MGEGGRDGEREEGGGGGEAEDFCGVELDDKGGRYE